MDCSSLRLLSKSLITELISPTMAQNNYIPITAFVKRSSIRYLNSCICIWHVIESPVDIREKREEAMKEGIHPNYQQTTIKCACGEIIDTGSTKKDIRVEICSKCHPFYTGKQKLVDTSGRVDKFNRKFGLSQNQSQ